MRFRSVQIQHDVLWTDLTKSSLVRPKEMSKLVLFFACQRSSEVMPEAQRVPEAYRGNRLQPRQLEVSW